jgi:hypothetical protein
MRWIALFVAVLTCSLAYADPAPNLLVNGDLEQPGGWSFALWPNAGKTPVGGALGRSDARVKSGQWALRIDTGAMADKAKELVFNGQVRPEAKELRGKRVDFSGWSYIEPGSAVRPISMTLRVWGEADPGKNGLLGTPFAIHVVGKPGEWTEFHASGTLPDDKINSIDLHCGLRADAQATVQYLDDLRLAEHVAPPLEVRLLKETLWRDETLPIEVSVASPAEGERVSIKLLDSSGHTAAQWDHPLSAKGTAQRIGLELPRPFLPEGIYVLRSELTQREQVLQTATEPLEILASPWESYNPNHLPQAGILGPRPDGFAVEGTVAPEDVVDVVPTPAEPEDTDASNEERSGDFVVFNREASDPLTRAARPAPGETAMPRVFACPGQYVPVQLGVLANKALTHLSVAVAPAAGHPEVSADQIDIRAMRTPKNLPVFLEKRPVIDVPAGQTQGYWVTLHIPQETAPGFYVARLRAAAEGTQPKDVPILIRVLPVQLPIVDKGYGFWWAMDGRWKGYYSSDHATAMEHIRKQFVLLREHGCNQISIYSLPMITRQPDGSFKYDFTRDLFPHHAYSFDDLVRVGLETGFLSKSHPIQYPGSDMLKHDYVAREFHMKPNSPEFDAFYHEACGVIDRWAKSKGITLAFACEDEIGNTIPRQQEALHYYPIARSAGCLTSVTDNSMWGGQFLTAQPRFDNVIDMRVFNFVLPEMLAQTRQSGDRLWLYNLGNPVIDPLQGRVAFGLFTERCGAEGYLQWAFQWPHQLKSPYASAASGRFEPYHYVLPAPDGPLPTVDFELAREGIIDARYLALAQQAGLAADSFLPDDLPADSTAIGPFARSHANGFFDAWRWRVARAAMGPVHIPGVREKE